MLSDGARVGPFVVERLLGEGAVGLVYLAVREPGGDQVALKVMRPVLSTNAIYRERFLREARVAREVSHRRLVPVLEAGECDGVAFLASAYVEGGSLAEQLAQVARLPVREAVRIAVQLAAGLGALHEHGIVHRDVKPGNVMLSAEGAALTDFGLAKGVAYTVLTRPGEVLGTLDYIAPELIGGDEASSAADLYSIGCLVYECLVGAPPFAGRGVFETAVAHMEEEPTDPRVVRPEIPSDVAWVVLQTLAKEPDERPPTAEAFANLLRSTRA